MKHLLSKLIKPSKQLQTHSGVARDVFSPDVVMGRFSRCAGDVLMAGDLWRGVCILGATGSGKSSASGKFFTAQMLQGGWGMLVTTVKPGDTEDIVALARQYGRGDDVILFGPDHEQWSFNPLAYESARPDAGGGLVENVARLLMTTLQASESGTLSHQDPFWTRAAMMLLRNALSLLIATGEEITFSNLGRLIASGPQGIEQLESKSWQQHSYCVDLLCLLGELVEAGKADAHELNVARQYWLGEFANLASATRSSICLTVSSLTDSFAREPMHRLFAGKTTLVPEFLTHGKIIVLDMPLKAYQDFGRMGQIIFKLCAFAALERRDVTQNPRPVGIVQDEFQELVTSEDMRFQATARSARVCNMCMTQSLSGLYARLGGQAGGQANVDALLTNLSIKVFHANSDPTTNAWVEQMMGKRWVYQASSSSGTGQKDPQRPWATVQPTVSSTTQKTQKSNVEAVKFLTMRTGGEKNNYVVDALLTITGPGPPHQI